LFHSCCFSFNKGGTFSPSFLAHFRGTNRFCAQFEIILGNYQNEAVCAKDLPEKFQSLKTEMKTSIVKFDEAYNIAELRGSKLKDLLYGWSE
jgi:hypothetical protein